ncbi:MAG: response regulator transcription factor [Deltaproteobacteria bacterium]|nr:response regulator transcription factor [Deltaproteobacteria bacterium]
MSRTTVLLIAGNAKIFPDLKHILRQDNIVIRHIERWEGRQSLADADAPHLIVLDCPGSGVEGLAVYQEIRARYSGLLVLVSEYGDERFHVLALGLGADASLTFSAGAPLVAANVKALLRRFAPTGPPSALTFGELIVNSNKRDAFVAGQAVRLSTIEFQLLWCLCQKPGLVVTRDEISLELYHAAYNGYDRNIDLYVSRIRQKIGDDPTFPRYLKTVRGVGYQFVGE